MHPILNPIIQPPISKPLAPFGVLPTALDSPLPPLSTPLPSLPLPGMLAPFPGALPADAFSLANPAAPQELSSLPLLSNINLRDVAYASQLCEASQHGVDLQRLLMPGSGFRAEFRNGQVLLTLPTAPTIEQGMRKGSDTELCYFIGNHLQQVLGSQYDFQLAEGFCPDYFTPDVGNSHSFLLMSARMNPAEQVIIDPALQKAGRIELLPGYIIRSLKPLSHAMLGGKAIYVPPVGYADGLALGLAKDLMPNTSEVPAKAMLYLTFEMKNGVPSVLLASQDTPQAMVEADPHLETLLQPTDALAQFLNSIRRDLVRTDLAWSMNQSAPASFISRH